MRWNIVLNICAHINEVDNFKSKVENTFYRYKTIIGKKLRARTEESREVELILGCQILNRFLELGRCESKLVA